MTVKTIELAKGAVVTVTAEYYCIHEDGDGWGEIHEYHDEGIKVSIDFSMNGKKYHKGKLTVYGDNQKWKKLVNIPEEVEAVLYFAGKDGVQINLKKENADKIVAAIESAKDEEAPVEYKTKISQKDEETRQREIKNAEKIIAKCEETIAKRGSLMTNAEAKKWLESYNNVMNEGEEGYLPRVYTQEDYDHAKARLAELKK